MRLLIAPALAAFLGVTAVDRAAASTCSAAAFATPRYVSLPGANHAHGFAGGDFNGDGHLDLAVIFLGPQGGQSLHVPLGDGAAEFTTVTTPLPPVPRLSQLLAADVTGDDVIDLIATGNDSVPAPHLVVLEGDGTGAFALRAPVVFGSGLFSEHFDLADVDGDGDLDVVALSSGFQVPFPGFAEVLTNDD